MTLQKLNSILCCLLFALWGVDAHASVIRAINTVTFLGSSNTVDSFNSADPLYSINGLYPLDQPDKTLAGGDILTDGVFSDSIQVGNALIKGRVATGATGTVGIGPSGSVGDRAWVEGGNLGIQPGHISADFGTLFPSVNIPANFSGQPPTGSVTINGKTYARAILYSGDYLLVGLSGSLYISTNITCRILVTGNISLSNASDEIRVSKGARVKLYMNAATFSVKGLGIINDNGNADSFMYLGANNNVSVTLTKSFTGAIYAPNADFSYSNIGNPAEFVGCVMSKSASINNAHLHFDENLYLTGPFRPIVTNQPQSQFATPGDSVTFTGSGTGPGPLSYQWYFRTNSPGITIPVVGATNSTLTISNVGIDKVGLYYLVIYNEFGGTASQTVELSVPLPPAVGTTKTNISVLAGANLYLSCAVQGTGPLTHQWIFQQTNVVPTGNYWFVLLTNLQPTHSGWYSLVVTNPYGATTSPPISLTVYETAAASLNASVATPKNPFQFSISGIPGYKYTVESSTNLSDWERISTNTAPFTFSDTNLEAYPQRFYRAVYLP